MCLRVWICSATATIGLTTPCVCGDVVSGRPPFTVTTPLKLAVLDLFLDDLDLTDSTNMCSILERGLVLGTG